MQEKSQYVSCFDLYKIMNNSNLRPLDKASQVYVALNQAFDFLPTLVFDVPDCGNMGIYTIQFEITANITFRGVSTMDPVNMEPEPLPNLKLTTYAYQADPGTDEPYHIRLDEVVRNMRTKNALFQVNAMTRTPNQGDATT